MWIAIVGLAKKGLPTADRISQVEKKFADKCEMGNLH